MSIFQKAAKIKLRFKAGNGTITTEDLWDLPLTSARKPCLDDIAKSLHKQLKESGEISFVETPTKTNTTLTLMFDIVKAVIQDKLASRAERANAIKKKEEKEVLLGLIKKKKGEALESLSEEELMKKLEEL